MDEKKLLIGMPSYSGMIPALMVQSMLQLVKPISCGFIIIERQRIDKARNTIVMEALKGGFDYLLFVDDDNPIPPETIIKLIEDDKDIVNVPILARNPNKSGGYDLCAFYSDEREVNGQKINLYRNITYFKDGGYLHKVDCVGMGCTLIKREVLTKMFEKYGESMFEFGNLLLPAPVEADGKIYTHRSMSEDCEFSERAANLGFELYLDTRIKPIHLTTLGYVKWSEN